MKTGTQKIYDGLEKACDMSLYWDSPDFHCFRMFEPDVRAFPAMCAVEALLSDCGVVALLWNVRAHWAEICEDAIHGYRLIGCDAAARDIERLSRECVRLQKTERAFRRLENAGESATPEEFDALWKKIKWSEKGLDYKNFDRIEKKREAYLGKQLKRILQEIKSAKEKGISKAKR